MGEVNDNNAGSAGSVNPPITKMLLRGRGKSGIQSGAQFGKVVGVGDDPTGLTNIFDRLDQLGGEFGIGI